jgi:peptide/nickel transport system permease protein
MTDGIEIPSESPHPKAPPPGQHGAAPTHPVDGHPAPPHPAGQPVSDRATAYYETPQWKLMWRRFRKHKVALWMLHVVILLYVICLNCDFLSPYNPSEIHARSVDMPPQVLHMGFVEGHTLPQIYVHPFQMIQDPVTLERRYSVIPQQRTPVQWFVRGLEWKFMGLVSTNVHLFGVDGSGGATCYLLGTDKLGQDMFSRILYGGRISLLLGLTGELLTFVLGVFLGGISGYYGGKIDIVIQRIVEILQSVPTIPIWLAMAAAIPRTWSPIQSYFAMTMILAIIGWTGLCRVVRGKLLALREEDYARAALLAGASERRVIFVHLVPNFLSHIIATMTLSIPGIILAETSLSYLGLGLRPPVVSWGVLLQDAQSVDSVINQPWMLLPAVMVILAVLAFNFAGDGLRDAADPYAN